MSLMRFGEQVLAVLDHLQDENYDPCPWGRCANALPECRQVGPLGLLICRLTDLLLLRHSR